MGSTPPSPMKKKGKNTMLIAVVAIMVVVALIAVVIMGGFLNAKAVTKTDSTLDRIRARGSIIMASEASFIPFEAYDPVNKSFYGFDIDLANKIRENVSTILNVSLTLDIRDVAFSGIPASMGSNQYDMSISGWTITDKRNESMLFSTPYYLAEAGFGMLVKSDNTNLNTVDDLVNATSIVVNTGTTSAIWLEDNLIKTGKYSVDKVKYLPTIAGCVQDVQIGQSQVFIIDKPTAEEYADKDGSGLKVTAIIPSYEPYGVALNKESHDLKTIIDLIINTMYANGEMEQLRIKWGLN